MSEDAPARRSECPLIHNERSVLTGFSEPPATRVPLSGFPACAARARKDQAYGSQTV